MAARTRRAKVSRINDKIDILNRNAAETFPANQVFRTVSVILSLVRVSARSVPICELPLMPQPGQNASQRRFRAII